MYSEIQNKNQYDLLSTQRYTKSQIKTKLIGIYF